MSTLILQMKPDRPQRPFVLVVDDDDLIRMLAADIVSDAGSSVVEAGNADEATALLEGQEGIRMVLTEIDMPGTMDGLGLVAQIRRRWPQIHLIVASGMEHLQRSRIPTGVFVFSKPYPRRQLRLCLRSVLA